MVDARIHREAVSVAITDADPDARLARVGVVAAHTLPATEISARFYRMSIVVAISRPHGWDMFDDPAL